MYECDVNGSGLALCVKFVNCAELQPWELIYCGNACLYSKRMVPGRQNVLYARLFGRGPGMNIGRATTGQTGGCVLHARSAKGIASFAYVRHVKYPVRSEIQAPRVGPQRLYSAPASSPSRLRRRRLGDEVGQGRPGQLCQGRLTVDRAAPKVYCPDSRQVQEEVKPA